MWAGTLAGSAAGAVMGALTGPATFFAGAALGAAGGALAARLIDSALERRCEDEPYFASEDSFEDFGPAYRFGHETFDSYRGRRFDDVEPELVDLWQSRGDDRRLTWSKARNAVRRVWSRSAAALSENAGNTAQSMQR